MARRTTKKTTLPVRVQETITDVLLEDELSESYMEYALSVIVSRAIPDARDGLKPVQRRILYAMLEAGLRFDKPYRKSIAAVGDTMKKYHPHGDSAIYEALVRMAQDWVMNAPLVDGHGNFGSLDDGPAAARYTEARLSAFAEALLADVEEDTVTFSPNFDASTKEPQVLPSGIPTLLTNGASGIAVGMATSIPPHNMGEVLAACQLLLEKPKSSLREVLKVVQAPDFPTGGHVVASKESLYDMYSTGRGSVRMRADAKIEDVSARRRGIIVTSLPYSTGPEKVIARVKELVALKKLDGIADVKDLTDRKNGLRLVFEIKTGFIPEAVLAELYRLTPLEESFSYNAVALVEGRPVVCDLLTLLNTYVNHRIEVVQRRCRYRLTKARARLHVLEALLKALDAIDEVVAIIRSSKDADTARQKLVKRLSIDAEQANHILDMPLRRLTSLEAGKIKDEVKELQKTAKMLEAVLASEKKQRDMVSAELLDVAAKFPTPRRCRVTAPAAQVVSLADEKKAPSESKKSAPQLTVRTEPAVVGVLPDGKVQLNPKSPVSVSVATTTTGNVVALCENGHAFLLPVSELSDTPVETEAFTHSALRVVGLFNAGDHFFAATAQGLVKRVAGETPTVSHFSRAGETGVQVMSLKSDDKVVAAALCTDSHELVFVTSRAQLLRISASNVRPQGRPASGVAGVKLAKSDTVITAAAVSQADACKVAVLTDAQNAKASNLEDYPLQGRATGGLRCLTMKKNDAKLTAAVVTASALFALDARHKVIEHDWAPVRRDASGQPVATAAKTLAASAL